MGVGNVVDGMRAGWMDSHSQEATQRPNPLLIQLCADNPLKWVAVQLVAIATARTSPTPSPGTTVVFPIPRCASFPPTPFDSNFRVLDPYF